MDALRFDRLSRMLAGERTRRGVLGALVGAAIVTPTLVADAARGRGSRKRRGKKALTSEHYHHRKFTYCLNGTTRRGLRRKKAALLAQGATAGRCAGGCTPDAVVVTCTGTCGVTTNNCGASVDCGACPCRSSAECGACRTCQENGRCSELCPEGGCCDGAMCQPGDQAGACGADGVMCAVCEKPSECDSNHTCACTKTSCEAEQASCGEISDGCGGTLQCGPCDGGLTCCNNNCADLSSDTDNCGGCGVVCPTNEFCADTCFCATNSNYVLCLRPSGEVCSEICCFSENVPPDGCCPTETVDKDGMCCATAEFTSDGTCVTYYEQG